MLIRVTGIQLTLCQNMTVVLRMFEPGCGTFSGFGHISE